MAPYRKVLDIPAQNVLADMFRYDAESGDLYWKPRQGMHPSWNPKNAGKRAGSVNSGGRLQVKINNRLYQAHRVIVKLVQNVEPEEVDHIDGNPLNNRIGNLRPTVRLMNAKNRPLYKNNKTGFKGVSFDNTTGKYLAQVQVDGKNRVVARCETPEAASAAYETASAAMHGEFKRRL